MEKYDFDLFIIGAGSGGVRAARLASKLGKRVGIAEEYRFGGTCVIRGCVPKKLMVFASSYSKIFQESVGFGWDQKERSFSWGKFSKRMNSEIDRLEQIYNELLLSSKVKIFQQKAKLTSSNSIILNDKTEVTSKYVLIATGGEPLKLDIKGGDLTITSNDIFNLKHLPQKMVIIGGGYIACEFASIFNGFGTEVSIIYRGDRILRGFDNDIRESIEKAFLQKGIKILNNCSPESIRSKHDKFELQLSNNHLISTDIVLSAIGRKPNTENLGLDILKLDLTKQGAIRVNEFQQTSQKSIYAIGDVTNRLNLTPVAIRDAVALINTIFGEKKQSPDHKLVPTAVFTKPEVGTVGLTEKEARENFNVKIFKTYFSGLGSKIKNNQEKIMMKLVVCNRTDKILGCHIVGDGASEMIQMFGISMKMGVKKKDLDSTCAVHPTIAEEIVTLS